MDIDRFIYLLWEEGVVSIGRTDDLKNLSRASVVIENGDEIIVGNLVACLEVRRLTSSAQVSLTSFSTSIIGSVCTAYAVGLSDPTQDLELGDVVAQFKKTIDASGFSDAHISELREIAVSETGEDDFRVHFGLMLCRWYVAGRNAREGNPHTLHS